MRRIFSPPFDSLDFFKYCSPTNPFAFGFASVHVEYRRCADCGFIFTDFFDDWTPQEFATYVYNDDYLRVDLEYAEIRPNNVAAQVAERLAAFREIDILDYGSGSGAFSERMAAHGFANITNYDPFSSPTRPAGAFSLITCFEVIEHTVSPGACLKDMVSFLAPGGCIVFSQPLQPEDIETIRGNWRDTSARATGTHRSSPRTRLRGLPLIVGWSSTAEAGCMALARRMPPSVRVTS